PVVLACRASGQQSGVAKRVRNLVEPETVGVRCSVLLVVLRLRVDLITGIGIVTLNGSLISARLIFQESPEHAGTGRLNAALHEYPLIQYTRRPRSGQVNNRRSRRAGERRPYGCYQ